MASQGYVQTSAQLALSLERKKRKDEKASKVVTEAKLNEADCSLSAVPMLERRWLNAVNLNTNKSKVSTSMSSEKGVLRVMTWNMLAQCLIRRELYPASDCLKLKQREKMLFSEILRSGADIICLQEVDRLESLLSVLESAGYSFISATGIRKKHGCVIAYSSAFRLIRELSVGYDDISMLTGARMYRRSTFETKNVALLAAFEDLRKKTPVIVATTHLFWHPEYTYERTRQASMLLHSLETLSKELELGNCPYIIAGDFNFTPSDAAYSLLVGDRLSPRQVKELLVSRISQDLLNPMSPDSQSLNDSAVAQDLGGTERSGNQDEHRLSEIMELVKTFQNYSTLRSSYDNFEGLDQRLTYGARVKVEDLRRGRNEPCFTSYTHYWKSTLDYIFISDPPDYNGNITGILEPFSEEELRPGIPRTGVCGSDHVPLMVSLNWVNKRSNDSIRVDESRVM